MILVDQLEELITVAPEEAREPFLDELWYQLSHLLDLGFHRLSCRFGIPGLPS